MSVKKILVIDDEEHFCRALKKGLEMKSTFKVLTATRGEEGMRLAGIEKPDLILLDIMMPGMAGTEMAEELSENPVTSSIPIIFVTAIVKEDEVRKRSGVSGGRTFVAKPVKIDELIKKMNAVLPHA